MLFNSAFNSAFKLNPGFVSAPWAAAAPLHLGAVFLATIMTFRQFLSVLISCYLFGQGLSLIQWFGVVLVLAPVGVRVMQMRAAAQLEVRRCRLNTSG